MANFNITIKKIASFEGGYQCYPDDNGNWTGGKKGKGVLIGTNRGITAPELAKHLNRTPSVLDMKNLSHDTAVGIYKKNYWDTIRGDEINSQELADQVCDMAVNAGVVAAIKLACRITGVKEKTKMTNDILNKLNNV